MNRHFFETVAATLVAIGLVVAGVIVYSSIKSDTPSLQHNEPPIVEQQTRCDVDGDGDIDIYGSSCRFYPGTENQWVTNAGPCIWDADDLVLEFAPATAPACVWSDSVPHDWKYMACGTLQNKTGALTARIRFEPQGIFREASVNLNRQARSQCVTICVTGLQYDGDQNLTPQPYETVPYQGGGGGTLGKAVPTLVHFDIETTGNFRQTSQHWAVELDTNDLCTPSQCQGDSIHEARICWDE